MKKPGVHSLNEVIRVNIPILGQTSFASYHALRTHLLNYIPAKQSKKHQANLVIKNIKTKNRGGIIPIKKKLKRHGN